MDLYGTGIPWHGMMFMTRKGDELELSYHHDMTDDRKEDGFSFISAAHSSLTRFKEANPEKEELILFTDGARCYTGKFTTLALAELSAWCGVQITNHHTGMCDCVCTLERKNVVIYQHVGGPVDSLYFVALSLSWPSCL